MEIMVRIGTETLCTANLVMMISSIMKKIFVIDEVIGLGLSDKSFFRQAVPKNKRNK